MTGHEKIFVIDDEVHVCDTIEEALTQEGFRVSRFDNPILANAFISSFSKSFVSAMFFQ